MADFRQAALAALGGIPSPAPAPPASSPTLLPQSPWMSQQPAATREVRVPPIAPSWMTDQALAQTNAWRQRNGMLPMVRNAQQQRDVVQHQIKSAGTTDGVHLVEDSGAIPGGNNKLDHLVSRAAGQIVGSLEQTPAGLFQLGKAAALDVTDIPRKAISSTGLADVGGSWTPHRLLNVGKNVAEQTAQDVLHPADRPGYLLMDALAALTGAAGAPARLGAIGDAARAAEAAGASRAGIVARAAARGILGPKPEYMTIRLPGGEFVELDPETGAEVTRTGQPMTVEKRLTPNRLLQPLQVKRLEQLQQRLDAGTVREFQPKTIIGGREIPNPVAGLGNFWEQHLGAQARFARQARALHQTEALTAGEEPSRLAGMLQPTVVQQLADRLLGGPTRAMPKGADEWMQARSFNPAAFDANPDAHLEALQHVHAQLARAADSADQVNAHLGKVGELQRARDFHAQLEQLAPKTRQKLEDALTIQQQLVAQRQGQMLSRGLLQPESATFRNLAPHNVYEHLQQLAPLKAQLADVRGKMGELEQQHAALADQVKQGIVHPAVADRTRQQLAVEHGKLADQAALLEQQIAPLEHVGPLGREVTRLAPGKPPSRQAAEAFGAASQSEKHIAKLSAFRQKYVGQLTAAKEATRARTTQEARDMIAATEAELDRRFAAHILKKPLEEITPKDVRDLPKQFGDARLQAQENVLKGIQAKAEAGQRVRGGSRALRQAKPKGTVKERMMLEERQKWERTIRVAAEQHPESFPQYADLARRRAEAERAQRFLDELEQKRNPADKRVLQDEFAGVFGVEKKPVEAAPSFLEGAARARELHDRIAEINRELAALPPESANLNEYLRISNMDTARSAAEDARLRELRPLVEPEFEHHRKVDQLRSERHTLERQLAALTEGRPGAAVEANPVPRPRIPPPTSTQRAEAFGTVSRHSPEFVAELEKRIARLDEEIGKHHAILERARATLLEKQNRQPLIGQVAGLPAPVSRYAQAIRHETAIERRVPPNPEELKQLEEQTLPAIQRARADLAAQGKDRSAEANALAREERQVRERIDALRNPLEDAGGAYRTGPLSAGPTPKSPLSFKPPSVGAHGATRPPKGRIDPSLSHEITGKSISMGSYRMESTKLTSDTIHAASRLFTALDGFTNLWGTSSPVRRSRFDVPVRDPARIAPELRRLLAKAERGEQITEEELQRASQIAAGHLESELHLTNPNNPKEILVDGKALALDGIPIGEGSDLTHLGVRWADRRHIEAMREKPNERTTGVKIADAINNPARLLYIYGKLSYILNLPGNLGMQAMTQGLFSPANYKIALQLRRQLVAGGIDRLKAEKIASRIETWVGEGKARGQQVNSGILGGATNKAAMFWSHFIDRPSRISSFVHEMRKEGLIHGLGQLSEEDAKRVHDFVLGNNTKRQHTLRREANKNMVEFDNLSDFEKNTLRHYVFIYPWVRGATLWTLKYMAEHPGKTWTMTQLAQIAATQQYEELGFHLPSYLERAGVFSLGVDHGVAQLVNPSALSTFSTATNNARLMLGLFAAPQKSGAEFLRSAASPAVQLLVGALTGTDALGRSYTDGALLGALKEQAQGLPGYTLLQAAGLVGQHGGPGKPAAQQQTYKPLDALGVLGRATIGGLMPRPADTAVLQAKAAKEDRANMTPRQRFHVDADGLEKQLGVVYRAFQLSPADQEGFDSAFQNWRTRRATYIEEAKKQGVPSLGARDRLKIDLALLDRSTKGKQHAGIVELLNTIPSLDDSQVASVRNQILGALGQGNLSELMTAARASGIAINFPGGHQPAAAMLTVPGSTPRGLVQAGNIDLATRGKNSEVHNADGSTSTVRTITITVDGGKAVLLPTVVKVNGTWEVVSDKDAVAHYQQTGENLGTFSSETAADAYAQRLHNWEASRIASP